ncbi:MAG: diadenylate cyclase [Eubacterium sp.]
MFEKNTPLHDGAVIIEGDTIVSATCYIPLSDSTSISKDLEQDIEYGLDL